MKFSSFLAEQDPYARWKRHITQSANPSAQNSVSPPVKKKVPPKKKMVARELYPHLKTGQSDIPNTISNTNRDSVDFDPKAVGHVARPQQQQKAGQVFTTPTKPLTQQQKAQQAQLKQNLAAKHKGGPATQNPPAQTPATNQPAASAPAAQSYTPDQASKQILAIANQAKSSGNVQQIDQLITMLQNIHQQGAKVAPGVRLRDEAGREALKIWKQSMKGTPEFKSLVAQNLANMAKTGGRR